MYTRNLPEIMPEAQVADFLGLSLKGFRNYRRSGAGPPYCQLGRSVVYRRADVESWLLSRRVVPGDHDPAANATASEPA